jgi:hypothetical protein
MTIRLFLQSSALLMVSVVIAEEPPQPKAQPPVMDREYVLIQHGQNIGMSGCLALSAAGQIHWIEDSPVKDSYEDFGYHTTWDLNGLTMKINGHSLAVDDKHKLIAAKTSAQTYEILYLRSDPDRSRKSPYKIILREAKSKRDSTLKIEAKSVPVRSQKNPERSIDVHEVSVREGLDGAEFMFSGMSK